MREPAGRSELVVIEDDPDLRSLIRLAAELTGGYRVVGEAEDGAAAIPLVEQTRPDLVVVDLGLPDMPGPELVSTLHAVAPEAGIVVFTGATPSSSADLEWLPAGAELVVKGDIDHLLAAVDSVATRAGAPTSDRVSAG